MIQKVAVITGGGGFIGRQICFQLAEKGFFVVVCDYNETAANEVVTKIKASGGKAKAQYVDVRNANECADIVQNTVKDFDKIDLLVTVAGGSTREKMKYFCDQELSVIQDNINMNFYGSLYFAHAVSKHMAAQKNGKIIFITSVLGSQGERRCAEYSAAKAGLITLAKVLAMEMGECGVTVNCVSPGLVERKSADVSSRNYLGRNCTATDIANAVSFLSSEKADFITGVDLKVDGGWGLGVQNNIAKGR